jgi:hypothetical protein
MPDLISLELKDGNAPTLEELLAQPLMGDTAGTKPFAWDTTGFKAFVNSFLRDFSRSGVKRRIALRKSAFPRISMRIALPLC